jgi:pantetheine-phosphate adenylyltransferase
MNNLEKQFLIGVYPGTFDPITNGHIDIITRSVKVVDKLVIAVAANGGKGPLFDLESRVLMCQKQLVRIADECRGVPIEVVSFDKLLMDFVADIEARVIIRGLRAVSDFEYEFQMAGMNARLNPLIETLFLMASESNQFISSRFVKEIAGFGGDINHFVPNEVAKKVYTAQKDKN